MHWARAHYDQSKESHHRSDSSMHCSYELIGITGMDCKWISLVARVMDTPTNGAVQSKSSGNIDDAKLCIIKKYRDNIFQDTEKAVFYWRAWDQQDLGLSLLSRWWCLQLEDAPLPVAGWSASACKYFKKRKASNEDFLKNLEHLKQIHKEGIFHQDIGPKNMVFFVDEMVLINFYYAIFEDSPKSRDSTRSLGPHIQW